MKNVYFIVLHYQAIHTTIECVDSLLKLNHDNSTIRIIIVDNASENGSGKELKDRYKNNEIVDVFLNNYNSGFAKGNNIGFSIAKKRGADFIILINNDTKIPDCNFVNKLISLYEEEGFALLGPDVKSVYDGVHQNPAKGFRINKNSVRKRIIRSHLILILNDLHLADKIPLKHSKINYQNNYRQQYIIDDSLDLVLHGSCLIFSQDYISLYDGLVPDTFMYFEENILAYICAIHNLKMLYSPKISIEHYRHISTNTQNKKERERIQFFHSNAIISLRVLLKIVRENE